MSRNDSRRQRVKIKQQPPQPSAPTPPTTPNPFTAAFVVPTEFVDLPTGAGFYSEDNPLSQIERVEIKHMTAREEDILGNQDFISRGIVLDKLIESLLMDKSIKVADFSDVDKIAILATARKTGFGDEYKQNMTCEECNQESVFVFSMETMIDNANSETREAPDALFSKSEDGTFSINLDVSGYTAICRPLNSDDFTYLADLEKQRNKHSLEFNYTIEFLRRILIAVRRTETPLETTSDSAIISQFLDFIPAQDSRKLKQAHSFLIPTFRMYEEVECPKCTSEEEREVPFSWAMFWGDT
jgi:hypothetical protein